MPYRGVSISEPAHVQKPAQEPREARFYAGFQTLQKRAQSSQKRAQILESVTFDGIWGRKIIFKIPKNSLTAPKNRLRRPKITLRGLKIALRSPKIHLDFLASLPELTAKDREPLPEPAASGKHRRTGNRRQSLLHAGTGKMFIDFQGMGVAHRSPMDPGKPRSRPDLLKSPGTDAAASQDREKLEGLSRDPTALFAYRRDTRRF